MMKCFAHGKNVREIQFKNNGKSENSWPYDSTMVIDVELMPSSPNTTPPITTSTETNTNFSFF